jgi:N-acetylglutamate synthase-like GNAT family acetyltransferase
LPWDASGNREWLENRKQFAGQRRHYAAEEVPAGAAVGYGAIEEGPDSGSFRICIVMDPPLLATETGALMYERLAADLTALGAKSAWVREYARDTAILSFFAQRGFVERDRFAPPGYEEMAVMTKRLE